MLTRYFQLKPVAIFRRAALDGPGTFSNFLRERDITQSLVCVDESASIPHDPRLFSGLVFLGGPMSVNDDLPWIADALQLIQRAVAEDIPVLGHCLGGQLMAKAMGAAVTRNPVFEIGWGRMWVEPNPVARHWFGDCAEFQSFHWHNETFAIPAGATRLAASEHCANQAFALGKHLGLQCHVEMEPDGIRAWFAASAGKVAASAGRGAQSVVEIDAGIERYSRQLSATAGKLYARWVEGLAI